VLQLGHEPARYNPRHRPGRSPVSDAVFTAVSIAFFAICGAYAYFCDKVR